MNLLIAFYKLEKGRLHISYFNSMINKTVIQSKQKKTKAVQDYARFALSQELMSKSIVNLMLQSTLFALSPVKSIFLILITP